MSKISRQVGTTSLLADLFCQNNSVATGAGLTGLAFGTSGLTAYYHRNTASADVAITLATMTLGTWATGGFIVVDTTNMPGVYQIGIPNAALVSGADTVVIYLQGATNMAPVVLEIELTATSNQDAVHGGMSCLPNTAVTTNASLLTSGTGTDQLSVSAGKILLQATQAGVTIPTVTTVTNQLTAAAIATGVWQDSTAGDFTTASSMGKCLYIANVAPGGTGGHFIAGTNAATTITTSLTTHLIGTVDTVTTVTNQLTAAAIATGVWQDSTAGDFTTASSIGKSLYTSGVVPGGTNGLFIAGTNAATTITTSLTTHLIGTVDTVTTVTNQLTAAAIATAFWTDTTAGDFTTASSPGKILVAQLGGAFTTASSSVYSTASLANAPTGGSAPTTAQIATAVWADPFSSSDFSTANSPGAFLKSDTAQTGDSFARIGATGSGLSSLAPASTALAATTAIPTTGNTANTLADCLNAARAQGFGKWTVVGTTLTLFAADGATAVRTFTLDSGTAPTQRV